MKEIKLVIPDKVQLVNATLVWTDMGSVVTKNITIYSDTTNSPIVVEDNQILSSDLISNAIEDDIIGKKVYKFRIVNKYNNRLAQSVWETSNYVECLEIEERIGTKTDKKVVGTLVFKTREDAEDRIKELKGTKYKVY